LVADLGPDDKGAALITARLKGADRDTFTPFFDEFCRRFGPPAGMTMRDQQEETSVQKKKFDDTNRGALFNESHNKQKADDRDYAGTLNVEGREYWLSGWVKTSKAGKKFLSISVKAKNEPAAQAKRDFNDSVES